MYRAFYLEKSLFLLLFWRKVKPLRLTNDSLKRCESNDNQNHFATFYASLVGLARFSEPVQEALAFEQEDNLMNHGRNTVRFQIND